MNEDELKEAREIWYEFLAAVQDLELDIDLTEEQEEFPAKAFEHL